MFPSFINGGRIEFWFPVLDNKGNALFNPQIGHSYSTGYIMDCWVFYNGVYDIATKCILMKSQITPNHAVVELVSFPALVSATVVLIYITKIKNPSYFNDPLPSSSEIMNVNLKINIFNIDTTISSPHIILTISISSKTYDKHQQILTTISHLDCNLRRSKLTLVFTLIFIFWNPTVVFASIPI